MENDTFSGDGFIYRSEDETEAIVQVTNILNDERRKDTTISIAFKTDVPQRRNINKQQVRLHISDACGGARPFDPFCLHVCDSVCPSDFLRT